MSRGPGTLQRRIMAYVNNHTASGRAEGDPDPRPVKMELLADGTGAHPESIRRALKSLERMGYATLGWTNGYGYDGTRWFQAGPTVLLTDAGLTYAERLSADYYSALKHGRPSARPRWCQGCGGKPERAQANGKGWCHGCWTAVAHLSADERPTHPGPDGHDTDARDRLMAIIGGAG